jgi:hypothetical protein
MYELYKRGLKIKLRFKRYNRICGIDFSHGRDISIVLKGNVIHRHFKPEYPSTLISLNFLLITLINITDKTKTRMF